MPRIKTYLGPKIQIQPKDLHKYEPARIYAAEAKHDGHWAEVTTDSTGKIVKIVGRSGNVFSGTNVAGLIGHQVHVADSVLIAELEAGTEAANKRNAHLSHRRLFVFDVVRLLGNDVTKMVYEQRRELLELIFSKSIKNDQRIQLVEQTTKDFVAFFDRIQQADGEGIVLKRLGKSYRTGGADGKTNDWIRCKRFRFVDYVVMSIGRSEGGSPNFQVGLYDKGKLSRVATIKNIPDKLDCASLVGKVIECKGAEVHASGALRHGHYFRTRNDKFSEECTLEAALES